MFFFKQKTAYEMRISDGSSDVCSSDLHEEALRALRQAAAGNVDVLLLQPLDHGLDRQVQLGQLLLVDIDLDLVLEATADLDRGDALDRLEPLLQDIVGEIGRASCRERVCQYV